MSLLIEVAVATSYISGSVRLPFSFILFFKPQSYLFFLTLLSFESSHYAHLNIVTRVRKEKIPVLKTFLSLLQLFLFSILIPNLRKFESTL